MKIKVNSVDSSQNGQSHVEHKDSIKDIKLASNINGPNEDELKRVPKNYKLIEEEQSVTIS